jgi:hypothetical protein
VRSLDEASEGELGAPSHLMTWGRRRLPIDHLRQQVRAGL